MRADVFSPAMVRAEYREVPLAAYQGNPFIEALPSVLTTEEAMRRLTRLLPYQEQECQLPLELRLHCPQQVLHFLQPLPIHIDLEQRFSRMIRGSYQSRNPVAPQFWQGLKANLQQFTTAPRPTTAMTGFTILGLSGVGKTTALEAILDLYPQVIVHSCYHGRPLTCLQIVWLKLNCPFDGSAKGLCLNFFQALDGLLGTDYSLNYARRGRASTDEMLPCMARVAAVHGLGVLVIDEIQHLTEAHSGGAQRMLNFFVQLVNTIGMPVVLVGTPKAQAVLTSEFRQIRRGSGQGDLVWDRMHLDAVWQLFVESLWHYQYVHQRAPLTPQLSATLYDVSQGITDFAVKVFILAQIRAMTSGHETLTVDLLRSVAYDSLRLAAPALQALRSGDTRALHLLADLVPLDVFTHIHHALQEMTVTTAERPSPPPETSSALPPPSAIRQPAQRRRPMAAPQGSLPQMKHNAEKAQASVYEVLREGGHLRNAMEYLTGEVRS